jgi:hypothetical protein
MRFMGRLQDKPLFVFGVSAAIAALGRDLLPIGSALLPTRNRRACSYRSSRATVAKIAKRVKQAA